MQEKEVKFCLYTSQNINLAYPISDNLLNIHKAELCFLKFVSQQHYEYDRARFLME